MADNDGGRSGVGQHFGCDITGMRTELFGVAVLAADRDGRTPRRRGEACDQRCRRTDHHVDIGGPLAKHPRAGDDFFQFADRALQPVHFPIACDQRTGRHYWFSETSALKSLTNSC